MARLQFHRLDFACCMGFLVYSASAVVTPICFLILARELSFGFVAGGFGEVMRAVLILLVLLVSGVVAARYGKVRSLGAGTLILGIGLVFYALSPNYGTLLLAMAMLGIGGGVIEALINPLVQDLHPENSGRYLNIVNGFYSIGVLATVLTAGGLLTQGVSWRLVLGGLGGFTLLVSGVFLLLNKDVSQPKGPSSMQVWRHKLEIVKNRRFWLFAAAMFLVGGAEGAFTFWSASYIQLRFQALPSAGGIGTACFAGGMVVGRLASGWLVRQDRLWHLIVGSAIAGLSISLVFPFVTSILGVFCVLFIAGLSIACFWPSLQSYAADRMDVDSTSLFILLSCAGIPGLGFMTWLMGLVAGWTGLQGSFFLIPMLFPLLIVLMQLERGDQTSKGIEI